MILIRNIKNYHPANFLIFIVIGILAWFKTFISKDLGGIYLDPEPVPIYNWIYHVLENVNLLCKIIGFLLVLFQAIILNGILNIYNLLGFRSYLPGIFFIIITANFPEYQLLHPILFANLFLLIAWERISNIIEKGNSFSAFFNSASLIGIATLFYPNYIYFLVIIILSTILNRISHIREFIMILLGFVTVWYFYFTLNYILFSSIQLSVIEPNIGFSMSELFDLSLEQKLFLAYLGLLLFFVSIQLGGYISNSKIQLRRNLKFLFVWFLVGLSMFMFTKSSIEVIYPLAVPISILLAILFINIKNKWFAEILWVILLAISFMNQIFPHFLLA